MGLARDSALSIGASAVGLGTGLAASIIIARTLGPAGRGQYSLLVLVPDMMLKFANLGLATATVYHINQRGWNRSEVVSASLSTGFALSILALVGFWLLYPFLSANLLAGIDSGLLVLAICTLPLIMVNFLTQSILVARDRIAQYALLHVSSQVIFLGLMVLSVLTLRLGVLGAVLSNLAATTVVCALGLWIVNGRWSIRPAYHWMLVRGLLTFGVKGQIGTLLAFLSGRVDIFLVNAYLSTSDVGYYSLAVVLAELLLLIPSGVSQVLLPRAARLSDLELKGVMGVATRGLCVTLILSALVVAVVSKPVINVVYGPAFEQAAFPFLLLLPGVVARGMSSNLASYITGRGRPIVPSAISLITFLSNVALNLMLLPRWGLAGAAVSSTGTCAAGFLLLLFAYCRMSRITYRETLMVGTADLREYWAIIVASWDTLIHFLAARLRQSPVHPVKDVQ